MSDTLAGLKEAKLAKFEENGRQQIADAQRLAREWLQAQGRSRTGR